MFSLGRAKPAELAARIVFITGDIANEETVATRVKPALCVEKTGFAYSSSFQ